MVASFAAAHRLIMYLFVPLPPSQDHADLCQALALRRFLSAALRRDCSAQVPVKAAPAPHFRSQWLAGGGMTPHPPLPWPFSLNSDVKLEAQRRQSSVAAAELLPSLEGAEPDVADACGKVSPLMCCYFVINKEVVPPPPFYV